MGTHDEIEELADLAAVGAWEPDAHATSCAACAATLTAAREFRAWASGAIVPDAPPADLEERVIARFRATNTAAARRVRLLPGKCFLKWAAGAAAAIGLVVLGGSFDSPSTSWDGYVSLGDNVDTVSDGVTLDVTPSFAVEVADKVSVNGAFKEGTIPLVGYLFNKTGFSLDTGIAKDGENSSKSWAFQAGDGGLAKAELSLLKRINEAPADRAALGLRLSDESRGSVEGRTKLTKLEADAQVMVRQKEVELAQLGELRAKLSEKFGEAEDAKVQTVARPEALKAEFDVLANGEPQVSTLSVKLDPLPLQAAQKLVRNGKVGLEVASFEETQTKLAALVTAEKGYIAGTSVERLQNGKARATVELRVPSERFDAVVGQLKALGTVKTQSVNVEDMTKAYADVETRLAAKLAFADRLRKLLAEEKGKVDELLQVEKTLGETLEEIDRMKGELRFYDNRVSLSTLTLEIAEKDLGQPFEYVQTLQSRIRLVTTDVDAAYAAAQKAVLDAGGQVVDSKMTRQNDGAATGTIRARVDAAKFPDVRQALRGLGHVETDTVDQQKTARGGEPTSAAPVRVEQATIDLTVTTPAQVITRRAQIRVETKDVEAVYLASRKTVETAGGRVLDGGLSKRSDGGAASLTVQVDVEKFAALVEAFKVSGEVKQAVVNQSAGVVAVPVRERAEIVLVLQSPPAIIGEEHGIAKTVRETFGRSWTGLLWSLEKLFVGIALAGPWALAVVGGWLLWRRARRRKPAAAQ